MIRAILLLLALSTSAHAAGRRPIGGAIDIPVRDFSGLIDPHLVETRSGRLVASLYHLHLFRLRGEQLLPELASSAGTFASDQLTFTIAPARFHDGSAVTAQDVVASLKRLAALADASPVGRLIAALSFAARDTTVIITAPRGTHPDELRLLLARPEVAILKGGSPSSAGGPFRILKGDDEVRALVAWEGHPEGRPFLQEIRLLHLSSERERIAFAEGRVGLSFEPVEAFTPPITLRGGPTSWFVLFHPRLRTDPIRGLSHKLIIDARITRYVEGRASAALTPFPEAIDPTPSGLALSATPVLHPSLLIAYPEGERGADELARAVRDALRPISPDARVSPQRSLTPEVHRLADPIWDLALVRWEWASLSRFQAAHELARALGLDAPSPALVLGRRLDDWARNLSQRHQIVAAVHSEASLSVRARLDRIGRSGPLPEFSDAHRKAP
jgi:hypothetical protein